MTNTALIGDDAIPRLGPIHVVHHSNLCFVYLIKFNFHLFNPFSIYHKYYMSGTYPPICKYACACIF